MHPQGEWIHLWNALCHILKVFNIPFLLIILQSNSRREVLEISETRKVFLWMIIIIVRLVLRQYVCTESMEALRARSDKRTSLIQRVALCIYSHSFHLAVGLFASGFCLVPPDPCSLLFISLRRTCAKRCSVWLNIGIWQRTLRGAFDSGNGIHSGAGHNLGAEFV